MAGALWDGGRQGARVPWTCLDCAAVVTLA